MSSPLPSLPEELFLSSGRPLPCLPENREKKQAREAEEKLKKWREEKQAREAEEKLEEGREEKQRREV